MKYLDISGLNKFWNKIKSLLDDKIDKIENGKSSQFLKADGSIDNTEYLPINSYTPENILNKINEIDGKESGLDADMLDGKHNGELTALNFKIVKAANLNTSVDANTDLSNGGMLYNSQSYSKWLNAPSGMQVGSIIGITGNNADKRYSLQLGWDNADKLYARIYGVSDYYNWHQIAFTDSNVASADKLTTKQLTNEDLNDVTTVGVEYYALGGNSCTHRPLESSNDTFWLKVLGTNSDYCTQILSYSSANIYYRRKAGNADWSSWQLLATTDGAVAKLTTKQLTNEDLNNIKDRDFNSYFAASNNSVTNKPNNDNYPIHLQSFGASDWFIQICTNHFGTIYKRSYSSSTNTWSPWIKLSTENDPAPKLNPIHLTNEDLNTIKVFGIGCYYGYGNNTCINKPSGVSGFHLLVEGRESNYCVQTLIMEGNNSTYRRLCIDNTWYPWKKMLTEDDISDLITRIENLEAERK